MRSVSSKVIQLAVFGVAGLWVSMGQACNVPVFRYALERWQADPYDAIVFHQAPLQAGERALVERLEQSGQDRLANLAVKRVDLADAIAEPLLKLWREQVSPTSPWLVLKYPRKTGIERPAWAGPLNTGTVGALLESPARREIASKLLRGDAVVWLLLSGADSQRDAGFGHLLEVELRGAEQSLILPERSPADPPLNPALPLKIAFSTVRVGRGDPAERMLVGMLLNWNTNLAAQTETMLFPVFGRGRVIPPAVGSQIRPEAILDMAEFLTGPCSCEVKELNPGYDLLLAANWDSLADFQGAAVSTPPPLVGMSQFATAAAPNNPPPPGNAPAPLAVAGPTSRFPERQRLIRNLGVVLGVGVVLLSAMTFLLRAKSKRRHR